MSQYVLIFSLALTYAAVALPAHAQNVESVQSRQRSFTLPQPTKMRSRWSAGCSRNRLDPELEQYRAFCLFALGRSDEAHTAIERLMAVDPLYMPDAAEISPRVQAKRSRRHASGRCRK